MRWSSVELAFSRSALALVGVLAASACSQSPAPTQPTPFDGARALSLVREQVEFGARAPGTPGHRQVRDWITAKLEASGWSVEEYSESGPVGPITNIVASRTTEAPSLLLGAHYDTRLFADRDPDPALRTAPMPGANDGASGVAVLLELARTLPASAGAVYLAFFDAEDNANVAGWDGLAGSRALAKSLDPLPPAVVVVDMVGDADLQLYYESTSDARLREAIWMHAKRIGHGATFVPEVGPAILDDHTPFLEAGVAAVDIIDFDYPYWHTTHDTLDKVSSDSLAIVGSTLWSWITSSDGIPSGGTSTRSVAP